MEAEQPTLAQEGSKTDKYSCRKCRQVVFDSIAIAEHSSQKKVFKTRPDKRADGNYSTNCSSIFIEELPWMELHSDAVQGKIMCPIQNCGAKLGNFSQFGAQCSCGGWVCPAY